MKILYINNCGIFGGGDRSLLEMITAFPGGSVEPFLIAPRGNAVTFFREKGVKAISTFGISQFDNTRYSHYRSLRWLILLREIVYLPFTLLALVKAKRQWGRMDIIHFNEITLLAPIWMCSKLFKNVPIVVHVRSVQMDPHKVITRKITSFLLKQKATMVAIDETVRESLPSVMNASIIRNGMNIQHNDVEGDRNKPVDEELILGYVGNFLRLKGIMELLEAVKQCTEEGMKLKLILVGHRGSGPSVFHPFLKLAGFHQAMEKEVKAMIAETKLKNCVELVDFTIDIGKYYKLFDVLCFPTYLNACGRPVIEAALHGKPSIVTIDKDVKDTIINGETGICIKDNNPETIVKAIKSFHDDRKKMVLMGINAQNLARKSFDIQINAQKMIGIYSKLL
jgi:glycosyltransferase involved in cell wall biosynthesis